MAIVGREFSAVVLGLFEASIWFIRDQRLEVLTSQAFRGCNEGAASQWLSKSEEPLGLN